METRSKFFQLGVTFGFAILAILGVIFFAGIGGGGADQAGPVVVWGTAPRSVINSVLSDIKKDRDDFDRVTYIEKDKATYYDEFVEALAAGDGPDLFMLDASAFSEQQNKTQVTSFDTYRERDFKNAFIQEGELFFTEGGFVALPFTVDPLVMYWNRDILQSAGVAKVPEYWDEFLTLAPKITEKDDAFNVTQSAVALGEYSNVSHAKDILATLFFQAGTPIIATDGSVVLGERFDKPTVPAESALRFYTEFADPVRDVYSWNRALPNSRDAFIQGKVAMYFGYASELEVIRKANPNLNFDVTVFPQNRDEERITFGNLTGLAVSRQAQNPTGAFVVAQVLTSPTYNAQISNALGLPPVRREVLAQKPGVAYLDTFYDSALIAKGWLDPKPESTETIFKDMIESVLSGSLRIGGAVDTAERELFDLVR